VIARLHRDGFARRVCELIAAADDEGVERVARHETAEPHSRSARSGGGGLAGKELSLGATLAENVDGRR